MASLGVSWAGRLRVRHSHDGLASGRASETRGCPLAGRDLHGNPLHTDLCFWRLLLALCAIATPEAVLGECVAVLLRQWIEPRRRLHRRAAAAHRPLHACSPASRRKRVSVRPFHRVCPSGKMQSNLPEWSSKTLPFVKVARVVCGEKTKIETDFLNGRATCLPYYY